MGAGLGPAGLGLELRSALVGHGAVALSVDDEALAGLGEALGDHLGVESVGEDTRPVLEGAVGGDGDGAPMGVAVADDLKGELGLGRIHLEEGEVVVDDEELGAESIVPSKALSERRLGSSHNASHAKSAPRGR